MVAWEAVLEAARHEGFITLPMMSNMTATWGVGRWK